MSITWKEGIRIAEENGIGYDLFRVRVKHLNWDMDKACTEPVILASHCIYREFYKIAYKNGISRTAFRMRVKRGLTPNEACRQPLKKNGRKKTVCLTKIGKEK